MKLYFGLSFDDSYHPEPPMTTGGTHFAGTSGLIKILEKHYGCTTHQNNVDYLRIEQYRQALKKHLSKNKNTFYEASFLADQFATATELLSRRDELKRAGWNFSDTGAALPERLQCLLELERIVQDGGLAYGFADRLDHLCKIASERVQRIERIYVCNPRNLLPPEVCRLLDVVAQTGVNVSYFETYEPLPSKPDLRHFQQQLSGQLSPTDRVSAKGDGSLIILKGQNESELAAFLAKVAKDNPGFSPLTLLPRKTRILDNAFIQEGLPCMGISTASLARPALQLLKLVTTFIWQPLNPFKVLEFLSLPIKPLDEELANQLAIKMTQTPGVHSDAWYAAISQYFEQIDQKALTDRRINPEDIRAQYKFWFDRKRYELSEKAPKEEVITIFRYIQVWAYDLFDEKINNKPSLMMLSEQAQQLTELLTALPETHLSALELERIVRTIYEPAPIQFRPSEKGHWPFIHHPGSVYRNCHQLLWWGFIQDEPAHFFSRWYKVERSYLEEQGIKLINPTQENQLLVWSRKNPVLRCRDQLILCIPEKVLGKATNAHPLMGELQAIFDNIDALTIDLKSENSNKELLKHLNLPHKVQIPPREPGRPQALVQMQESQRLKTRDTETFTSLNDLFFYPHKWAFRYQLKFNKSTILSIVKDHTLMGNLSHKLLETLLQADPFTWSRSEVYQWIEEESKKLFFKEGAVLLLYGKEPIRVGFIKKMQYAAWSLINLIKSNNWTVYGVELPIEEAFKDIQIKGRIDLVLQRGKELAIIDLKWRGISYRTDMIRNEEDLQLVLYAKVLQHDRTWPHTAYYIIERGTMIARNNEAFEEINGINPNADRVDVNQQILQKMYATFSWRQAQLKKGLLEIRCAQTAQQLEAFYGAELMDVLEMKTEDARYDDYRVLIGLVV